VESLGRTRLCGEARPECSSVEHLEQHRVADRAISESMPRGDDRDLGRIPRDRAAPACRQLGEAGLALLDDLAMEPELDRAVGVPAGDIRWRAGASRSTGKRLILLPATVEVTPERTSAVGPDVGRLSQLRGTQSGRGACPAKTSSHHAHHEMRKSRRFVHQHPELPDPDLNQLYVCVRHGC